MLETESLSRSFGNLVAVDRVSLTVEEGELHSLIGPNGAGKTTFFDLITGAMEPSSGRVFFKDEDITGLPPHEVAKRGCSRSFQITSIFPELSVFENLRVTAQAVSDGRGSMLARKDRFPEPRERAEELLAMLDLDGLRDRTAKDLSHGQKRSLEIGLSLATDPDLLLLDEPTAGMSHEETQEVIELLDRIRSSFTIFLVEHDMDVVMSLSDRITVLHHGNVIASGEPNEIRADSQVREAYLGKEEADV